MKYCVKFTALVTAFLLAGIAQAQSILTGAKVGISVASESIVRRSSEEGSPILTISSKTGFAGGMFLELGFGPVAIQPELFYVMKGAQLESSFKNYVYNRDNQWYMDTTKSKLTLHYIDVPVLLKYQLPLSVIRLDVFAGPYIGFLVGSWNVVQNVKTYYIYSSRFTSADLSRETNLKEISSTDFGLTFGAGTEFSIVEATLTMDIRYSFGLTNIYKPKDRDLYRTMRNNGVMIMMGLGF